MNGRPQIKAYKLELLAIQTLRGLRSGRVWDRPLFFSRGEGLGNFLGHQNFFSPRVVHIFFFWWAIVCAIIFFKSNSGPGK